MSFFGLPVEHLMWIAGVWFDMSYEVFLWCYFYFVLLRFRLYDFVEAAALRSIVLRYASAPIGARVYFFLLFVYLECRFSRVYFSFCIISVFSLYGEYAVRVSFWIVFFYLVTTDWILTSACVRIQSIQKG